MYWRGEGYIQKGTGDVLAREGYIIEGIGHPNT